MPLGGETVGRAYVRILADGSEVPEGIRDALRDAEPDIRAAGAKGSEAYRQGFEEAYVDGDDRKVQRALANSLNVGAGRIDGIAESIADNLDTSLYNAIRKKVNDNDISEVIAQRLIGDFRKTGNFEALRNSLENDLPSLIRDATREIQRIEDQFRRDREAAYAEHTRRLTEERDLEFDRETRRLADLADLYDQAVEEDRRRDLQRRQDLDEEFEREARRLRSLADLYDEAVAEDLRRERERSQAYDAEFDIRARQLADYARLFDEADKRENDRRAEGIAQIRRQIRLLQGLYEDVEDGSRGAADNQARLIRLTRLLQEELRGYGGDDSLSAELARINRQTLDLSPRLNRTTRLFNDFGDGLGRLTGRGSRNNFLNLIGGMVSGFTKLIGVVPRAVALVGDEMAEAVANGGSRFVGFLSGIGKIGRISALAVGGFAAALGVLSLALGPLVGLLSQLVGILAALASSLAFAAVGSIAALAGAATVAVGAIGVLAFGLSNLADRDIARVKRATQDLRREFTDLGQDAGRVLTSQIAPQAQALEGVLQRIRPVTLGIAEALADVGTNLAQRLDSPGFQAFVDRIETFLPNAVRSLGDSLGNFGSGLGGLFTGAIPLIERFLNYLEDITERFSDFANSAEGQNQIQDFFERAGDSASAVGDFLAEVRDLLFEILDAGQGTGDSIFESMARGIENATQALEENPDALKDWFADAKETADDIGDLIDKIAELFDTLDNPATRAAGRGIIQLFTGLAYAFEVVADQIYAPVQGFKDLNKALDEVSVGGDFSKNLGDIFRSMGEGINKYAIQPLTNLINGNYFARIGRAALRGIQGIPNLFRRTFLRLPQPVQNAVLRIGGFFQRLPARIAGSIARIPGQFRNLFNRLPAPVQSVITRVVGFFRALPGRVSSGIASIPGRVRTLIAALPGIASTTLDRVLGFFRSLPGRILVAIIRIPSQVTGVFARIVDSIAGIPGRIIGLFAGLGSRIASAIGSINIPMPNIPDIPGLPAPFATGGVVKGTTYAMIGEAGPEAVVPLDRPLHLVDPSVRALSAIAQGYRLPAMASGGVAGRSIDASGWQIVTTAVDPRAAADEVLARLYGAVIG